MDTYCWQVAQEVSMYSNILESCLGKQCLLHRNRFLVSYVDGWVTFMTNCEELYNNLSKLNCRSCVAENCIVLMILGLTQALTRIGCLQPLESGPKVEEPCFAETGASLLLKYVKNQCIWKELHERDECVHTLPAWRYERARTHSDWDTLGLYEPGRYRTSFHVGRRQIWIWWSRLLYLLWPHLFRDSDFFFQRRRRESKRGIHSMIWSNHSLTSQERIFIRQFVERYV